MRIFVCLLIFNFSINTLSAQMDVSDKKAVLNTYKEQLLSLKAQLEREMEPIKPGEIERIVTFTVNTTELPNVVIESMEIYLKEGLYDFKEFTICSFDIRHLLTYKFSSTPEINFSASDIYIGKDVWSDFSESWRNEKKEKIPINSCRLNWSNEIDSDEFKVYLNDLIRLNSIVKQDKDLDPWKK